MRERERERERESERERERERESERFFVVVKIIILCAFTDNDLMNDD